MPKVLNQNEVDALMDLVQASEDEAPETPETPAATEAASSESESADGYNVTPSENVYIFAVKRPARGSTEHGASSEALH